MSLMPQQFARVCKFSILCLCFMFELKSKLRFFELSCATFLDMEFCVKESWANTSCNCTDASENKRPSEPVVGIAWHPFVTVAKQCENYHSQACTNTSCEQKVGGYLQQRLLESFKPSSQRNLPLSWSRNAFDQVHHKGSKAVPKSTSRKLQ